MEFLTNNVAMFALVAYVIVLVGARRKGKTF